MMKSMTVTQAARNFSDLVNRVQYQGASVELIKSKKVVAIISPVSLKPSMKIKDLLGFFESLPSLGEDASQFEKDMKDVDSAMPKGLDEWEL
ncbi:MAG: antitoxin [Methylococcales bacterium]|jgi:antitoxin (DNA-binding transcriptional repressor) of toxin-antitoxin stability system|nr:antitoxin [Methylococcales bacterium]